VHGALADHALARRRPARAAARQGRRRLDDGRPGLGPLHGRGRGRAAEQGDPLGAAAGREEGRPRRHEGRQAARLVGLSRFATGCIGVEQRGAERFVGVSPTWRRHAACSRVAPGGKMADTDQAQGDSGGSWWDGVTGAAGAAWGAAEAGAAKIPSGLDAAEKMGSETAKKVTEGLGEATGLGSKLASSALGAIPGIVNGISDSSKASDARLDGMLHEDDKDRVAFDNEKDAY